MAPAIAATSGPSPARASGRRPIAKPRIRAEAVAIDSPRPSRRRLAKVSCQSGIAPVWGSI